MRSTKEKGGGGVSEETCAQGQASQELVTSLKRASRMLSDSRSQHPARMCILSSLREVN